MIKDCCSRITLHRRVRELGLEEETRYSEIDDQELDVFVWTILALLPNSGEVMIRGALCGRGVRIQKSWLKESIQRVDPTRRERIVYDFSQDLQSPQEKLKTMLMKNFEGITKTVIVFLKKPY